MRTVTTVKTVYLFDELSPVAQAVAIEAECNAQSELFDGADCVYEDAANIGDILGIDLRTRKVTWGDGSIHWANCIYYSGFSSQGDGACFEGSYQYAKGSRAAIRAYAPSDTELHRIADDLYNLQRRFFYGLIAITRHRGHYYHSGCMIVDVTHDRDDSRALPEDELTQLLRDFADWIYRRLEAEYDYCTSDETAREYLSDSGYEFTENGGIA